MHKNCVQFPILLKFLMLATQIRTFRYTKSLTNLLLLTFVIYFRALNSLIMQDGRRRILFSKILKLEWCFHREIPRWQSPRQRPPSNRRNDRRDCCYSLLRGIELNFAILHVVVGWHTKGMHFWQGKFSNAKLNRKSEKNWWDILKGSSFIDRWH